MNKYRITYLIGQLDTSKNPPAFLPVIFPNFDGSQTVTLTDSYCDVEFETPQTPVDLGPLVKVESLS